MRCLHACPILCGTLLACNPVTGDGTLPDNRAAEIPAPAVREANAATQSPPVGPQEDALVPGTQFHAMGQVRCVTPGRRSARDCTAGVIRNRDGSATVTIFSPEGRSRAVAFDAQGVATGIDTAEEDGSARQAFAARRSRGTTVVTLGPERYEIPDALLTGG